jgi:hypothetical protein
MNQLVNRGLVASLHRSCDLTIQRFNALPFFLSAALFFSAAARAQTSLPDTATMRSSVSGQFVVINANPFPSPVRPSAAPANADIVRLDPALLAVSAERVKQPVWRELDVNPMTPWRGRIFLALHPATARNENVIIISTRFAGVWNYRVELPEFVSRTRLTRALTGAVLLELANRDNSGVRSAEIPAWLTEGLAQRVLSASASELIMSPPDKLVNGLPQSQFMASERGVDPLATARPVLRERPALTFEQLSWPDDAQLGGDDGGIYSASAQLFVSDLLALKDGAKNLRAMLSMLPRCYNWQTAFRAAFAADFPRPVDIEKWWALQMVNFAASDAGPLWIPAVSRDKLDEILSVPVEVRSAATNLPVHAVISLQAVISNLDLDQQVAVFQTKLRDLELAHWRMAPQYAVLTDAYRRALADYFDARTGVVSPFGGGKRPSATSSKKITADTVIKLDALDGQRRKIENSARPEIRIN